MGGGDPVPFFEKYKRRIIYMHYKDIKAYHRGLPNYMNNVIELGRGVIDFPALRRGEEVLLCWHLGEEEIGYWHGLEDGFGTRPVGAVGVRHLAGDVNLRRPQPL